MRLCTIEISCVPDRACELVDIFSKSYGFVLAVDSDDNKVLYSPTLSVVLSRKTDSRIAVHDSISNIVLETVNVEELYSEAIKLGEDVCRELTRFGCPCGQCCVFSLTSPFKTVQHTFTNCLSYALHHCSSHDNQHKCGLPYMERETWYEKLNRDVTEVDHVTFACSEHQSKHLITWYERVLGFKRFRVNPKEDEDGFRINCNANGMKLMAMEYFKCAESGVYSESSSNRDIKIVFAEPLPGSGPNQVGVFLEENGGPGVQHVAFHSRNILHTVSTLKERGVRFIHPPPEYYGEIGRLSEIEHIGLCSDRLKQLGILLDTEPTELYKSKDEDGSKSQERYLLQVFTEPLFDTRTFFFEYIQREGALGFGSGNIVALWRALQIHLTTSS